MSYYHNKTALKNLKAGEIQKQIDEAKEEGRKKGKAKKLEVLFFDIKDDAENVLNYINFHTTNNDWVDKFDLETIEMLAKNLKICYKKIKS